MAGPQIDAQAAAEKAKQDAQRLATKWIAELGVSEKAQQKWLSRGRKITRRYRKEDSENDAKRKFAMLWSNTETIRPAIYARPPEPVVSRRFKDADPVGRAAAEVLERALKYSADTQTLDETLRTATLDFVLVGRGQAWERYVPTHGDEVIPKIPVLQITDEAGERYEREDGEPLEDDAEILGDETEGFYTDGEPFRPVVFEESVTDYVAWEDFGHGVARTWGEVPYVWRRVYMCREELVDRFGEDIGKRVPLDWGPKTTRGQADQEHLTKKAAVYEIWDKQSRKAIWVSKSFNESPLDVRDDPLKLDGFFPCPKPLLGVVANDSLFPTPEYVYYQDQAEEIDELTQRIAELQDALKVVGFYAGEQKDNLSNLLQSKNNTLIPVPSWQSFKESGGARGMVEWWPIEQVVQAITACVQLRKQLIEDVYQITGVADILRGASDPRETAAAQGIKAQWGALRVRDRQHEIARFARDIIAIKGEVIAEHFSAETLAKMTGVKLPTGEEKAQAIAQQIQAMAAQQAQMAGLGGNGGPPMQEPQIPPQVQEILAKPSWDDVQALLKDNALRQFRIDIETDSTIEPNETEEKALATEFATALSAFVAQWGPQVAAQPQLAPLAGKLLKFVVRRYRAGRELEEVIEQTMQKIMASPAPQGEEQQQQAAPQGPSQQELAIQAAEVANESQRNQNDFALGQAELQLKEGDQQIKLQEQQLKLVALNRDPRPQATA